MMNLDHETQKQINQSIDLLKDLLKLDLLGIYLYGSAVVGGLQKYSDIDLFVVSERAMTEDKKMKLVKNLLQISGIYMKSSKFPIELTIVVKSEINPWHYPPRFDFQYGEWLRKEFESGNIEPWPSKEMPDVVLLIAKVLLASETLFGPSPDQLLCAAPYRDMLLANIDALKNLKADLHTDTRNVLLTYARIWNWLETDSIIISKPTAALWAISRLPKEYQAVLERARSICLGETNEHWNDIEPLIQPCVNFMMDQIDKKIILINRDCRYN